MSHYYDETLKGLWALADHARNPSLRNRARKAAEALTNLDTLLDELETRQGGHRETEVVDPEKAHKSGLENPPPTHVQTIIFEKEHWTVAKARKWLKEHDKKFGKVDVQTNTLRFRQQDPKDFKSGEFAMIRFGEPERGIQALVGHLK